MNDNDKGQVSRNAAEVYEEFFVPALFQEWTSRVAGAAKVQSGQRVLDVACGTGILARTVAERVRPAGSVVGLDLRLRARFPSTYPPILSPSPKHEAFQEGLAGPG
jgi:ubiquinone/menaquinone biosynthesis C-methylase UbiE